MSNANGLSFQQVALALALVLIAVVASRAWKLNLVQDMLVSTARSFVQLVAVGYGLDFIFGIDAWWMILLTVLVMMTTGAYTSVGRVKSLQKTFPIAWIAIGAGSALTIATMLLIDIIPFNSRYVIPLGGMIISNSMNAAALTMNRLTSDIRGNTLAIETSLALGKSWRQASRSYQREASVAGTLSTLNMMKTVGIVSLPGTMTGMILGGAEPIEAVLIQIIVVYMLLSATTITSIIAVELTVRRFFTPQHQLRRFMTAK